MRCLLTGSAPPSSVARKRVPTHTPMHPMAKEAATPRPSPMPPAASTGTGAGGIDGRGQKGHGADAAGVTTAFVPLGHEKVNARVGHASGILCVSGDAQYFHAPVVGIGHHESGVAQARAK